MMYHDLLVSLQKICMLVSITYFASRTDAFARLLLRTSRRKDKVLSYLFFSSLSLTEVILAPHNPLIDVRIVSSAAAGLLGGAWLGTAVGLTTGAISLLHAPWSLQDSLPPVIAGMLGGWVYRYRSTLAPKVVAGLLVGMLSHGVWLAIRSQRDFLIASWDVMTIQYVLPMFLSGIGVSLFLIIVGDMRAQREKIERSELAKAIGLANKTLRGLGSGLNEATASHIAEMVRRLARIPAVAIAVPGRLLAHEGEAADYHRRSGVPEIGMRAMEDGQRHATEKRSTWCDHPDCPFGAAVASPLVYDNKVVGSVILFQSRGTKLTPEVIDLGSEIAQFLTNYQMEVAKAEDQAVAVSKAELKALQAQVHPHFLFNALNTLAALCEIDPHEAAELTGKLGDFFRQSFRSGRELLSPLEDELSAVRAYLDIEQARFRNRLEVVQEIDAKCSGYLLPSFSLQPIVENAVVHGISKRTGKGHIKITVREKSERLLLCVIDNGRGFDPRCVNWKNNDNHALSMLKSRLERIYGSEFGFRIRSRPDEGTMVYLWLPKKRMN